MWWVSRGTSLRRHPSAALFSALLFALVATACGDDGTELRSPSPDLTTTTASTTTTVPASSGPTTAGADVEGDDAAPTTAPGVLQLTSPAFGEGAVIPDDYTCVGTDLSPPLAWSGVPAGTVELAVVVRDPDAEGFVHWVIAGLPSATAGLDQGKPPADATEALNDFGRTGWSGPCPPAGTHHYDFRLYALSEPSGVATDTAAAAAAERVETAPALASAALSGTAAAP